MHLVCPLQGLNSSTGFPSPICLQDSWQDLLQGKRKVSQHVYNSYKAQHMWPPFPARGVTCDWAARELKSRRRKFVAGSLIEPPSCPTDCEYPAVPGLCDIAKSTLPLKACVEPMVPPWVWVSASEGVMVARIILARGCVAMISFSWSSSRVAWELNICELEKRGVIGRLPPIHDVLIV